jgi:hypothetical protein
MAEDETKTHKEKQNAIESMFMKDSMMTEMKKKLETQIDSKNPDLIKALKLLISDDKDHD